MSHGLAVNAFDDLLEVHFEVPDGVGDPLTAAEQAQYERLKARPLPRAFAELLRAELERRLPTLPRGVGAGPSGHRYEHLRAVADSAVGSHHAGF